MLDLTLPHWTAVGDLYVAEVLPTPKGRAMTPESILLPHTAT
jgi:hypothetical protein